MKLKCPATSPDNQIATGGQYGAGNDSKPVAQGAPSWEPKQLRRCQRSRDREQRGDFLVSAGQSGAIVRDVEAACRLLVLVDQRAEFAIAGDVQGVVDQLLDYQSGDRLFFDAGLLP